MKLSGSLWILIFCASLATAQVEVDDKSNWTDRIYKGGGGGFSAGSNAYGKFFSISLSPIVGYMITPSASAGLGFTYQYTSYSEYNLSYSLYGVSPFVRYNFSDFFLTAEYNYLSVPYQVYSGGKSERVFRSRMLLGAGYSVPMGSGRGRINAMALYDVLYKQGYGFSSPWVFRVFVSF